MAGTSTRTRAAQSRRTPPRRKKNRRWLVRLSIAGGAVIAGLFGWAVVERHTAPAGNTQLDRFDAIIVLGNPADSDGNPSPTQLSRVTEAVREYERGVAPRLILTGGAVRNQFDEARVMARTAEAQGVPESALFVEPSARDTIQNACYAERIMKAHGWSSAEVVSSPSHLPRAAIIFSHLPILFRTHAAPPLEPQSEIYSRAVAALETLKTVRYLVWVQWGEQCR